MPVIACKLPHGFQIEHKNAIITLVGANIGEDLANVSKNGQPNDNASRAYGYGLTTVSEAQATAFEDWSNAVTFNNGNPGDGKLAHPFKALENGSILGPFKTDAEARKEVAAISGAVITGFEGLDPAKEGVEENKEASKK